MKETLISIESSLCNISSIVNLIRLADYEYSAIDIDNALQLVAETIDKEREKLTNVIIMNC